MEGGAGRNGEKPLAVAGTIAEMGAHWSRRQALGAGLLVPAVGLLPSGAVAVEWGTAEPFSFERLIVEAKEMAQRTYEPRPATAQWLSDLSPEQYRDIRYRPADSLPLADSPFSSSCSPRLYHRFPVRVYVVEAGQAREVLYDQPRSTLAKSKLPSPCKGRGLCRISRSLPVRGWWCPAGVLTFLGASYFRAVARDTRFGVSGRGLALETGLGKPEEFPAFTHFWVCARATRVIRCRSAPCSIAQA